jgi:hypothetical protein
MKALLIVLLVSSSAFAETPCKAVCARLTTCGELGVAEKRRADECEKSCDEQVRASAFVAAQVQKMAAQCTQLPVCAEVSECIKRVPVRPKPGGGFDGLFLPLPRELAARWLTVECAAMKKYHRLDEVMYRSPLPADLQALRTLSTLIQAIDATALAELTEKAWRKCPPKP